LRILSASRHKCFGLNRRNLATGCAHAHPLQCKFAGNDRIPRRPINAALRFCCTAQQPSDHQYCHAPPPDAASSAGCTRAAASAARTINEQENAARERSGSCARRAGGSDGRSHFPSTLSVASAALSRALSTSSWILSAVVSSPPFFMVSTT
jgi:hypothetical protein